MAYEITCPNGHKLQVKEEHFGLQVRCPICQSVMVVPDLSAGPGGSPPNQLPLMKGPSTMETSSSGMKSLGYVLLIVGIVAVLAARGMDNLGARDVDRAKAKVTAAKNDFNDEWEKKLEGAQGETQTDLEKQRSKARADLEKGKWRDLQIAARDAGMNNQLRGYWFELAFVIGSIVLAIGLLIVGTRGVGAERVICLVMLAIITFSLYVGGIAWLAAVKGLF